MLETILKDPIKENETKEKSVSVEIKQTICFYLGARVLLCSSSKELNVFDPNIRLLRTPKKRLLSFYDGLIIDADDERFNFRLYQKSDMPIDISYKSVKGLLVPIRVNGKLINTESYFW